MLYRVISVLATITTINKNPTGEISFGKSHYAPAVKIEHVFLDPKPLNLQIAHLDTLIKFHLPSQSYFTSTSTSTSKLYNVLKSIKNDAIDLKKIIDKAWNVESSRTCTITNIQLSITRVFEQLEAFNDRKKREIDFGDDESFRELYLEFEKAYNALINVDSGVIASLESELLNDILNKIESYKTSKDKSQIAGIRKIICEAVNQRRTNLLMNLLFGLVKDSSLLSKTTLLELPTYSINTLRTLIMSLIMGKETILGFNANECPEEGEKDKNTDNKVNTDENNMDKTIEEMKENKDKEDKFSLDLQKKGVICSTPNIKGSCELVSSVLKKNLIERHYHDPEFIETLNAHEMTYQDLMEKIETSYESSNQNKDLYTKELIYGEATVLNLDILNSVIYKHAETKKVILTENLKPLEKTIQYVLKQIKNIFNAKNELIDKTYYKNCPILKDINEIGIVNKKVFSFKEKSDNTIMLKIMPFCYDSKCFKIKLPSLMKIENKFCTYLAHSTNNKFAFCEKKIDEMPSCALAKKQSLDCIFVPTRPLKQYDLVNNVIYVCDGNFMKCEYFKYARVLHTQYINNEDLEIFDNEQNVFDISFVEEYETEIINAIITFLIIIISAIIIKCCTMYIQRCCTKPNFTKLCCYLCKEKINSDIELSTIRKTQATLNPNCP